MDMRFIACILTLVLISGCQVLAPTDGIDAAEPAEATKVEQESAQESGQTAPQPVETQRMEASKSEAPETGAEPQVPATGLAREETPPGHPLDLPECRAIRNAADPVDALSGKDRDTESLAVRLAAIYKGGPRRIAMFLDGTHNTKESRTNVWRLYTFAVNAACNGWPVAPRYFRGVGTDPMNGVRGGIAGNGLDELVRAPYQHLAETYRPGDEVFLFGFSRGAYAARALNGFIEFVGLLDGRSMDIDKRDVKKLFDIYTVANDGEARFEDRLRVAIAVETIDYPIYRRDDKVVVTAIGVFDTVAALGIQRDDFPDAYRTDLYAREGYHAMAIDEQRNDFRVLRFNESIDPGQSLKEVWFAGAHGNVGGGYGEGMEIVSLRWMLNELAEHHLFDAIDRALDCNGSRCELARFHDEFLDEKMFGKLGLHWRRPMRDDLIHGSVECRMQATESELLSPHPGRERYGRYEPEVLNLPLEAHYRMIPYRC